MCFICFQRNTDAATADNTRRLSANFRHSLAFAFQIAIRSFTRWYLYWAGKLHILFSSDNRYINFNSFIHFIVAADAEMTKKNIQIFR